MKAAVLQYFLALGLGPAIDACAKGCTRCEANAKAKHFTLPQSCEPLPLTIGKCLAADVLVREGQQILVLVETVPRFAVTCFIDDESIPTLLSALHMLILCLKPPTGLRHVPLRLDAAPAFQHIAQTGALSDIGVQVCIGSPKNVNKNPSGERAVQDLERPSCLLQPQGGRIMSVCLAQATAAMNAVIGSVGLSADEILYQRDQFTGHPLPIDDQLLIARQHSLRQKNNEPSALSKCQIPWPDVWFSVGISFTYMCPARTHIPHEE